MVIQQYLENLKINRSYNTWSSYKNCIKQFKNWFNKEICKDTHTQRMTAETYKLYLTNDRNLSTSSVNQHLAALKSLAQYTDQSYLESFKKVESLKIHQKKMRALSQYEIKSIFSYLKSSDIITKVIFYMLYFLGLRVSELANLKLSHIDLQKHIVTIVNTKGYKLHKVPINAKLCSLRGMIEQVIDQLGQYKDPIQKIQRTIKKLFKKLNIQDASCHTIRHSFCTSLYENGESIRIIQDLAGHSNINTTSKYIDVNEKDKQKAVNKL